MTAVPPNDSAQAYRTARKAFIAACEGAGVDAISRVAPQPGPDGRPLFLDTAALGPREAQKALLLVCGGEAGTAGFGSKIQTRLLRQGVKPPEGARLVLIHALDPAAFAGGVASDPDWPNQMLGVIAAEDLSRVQMLQVLVLGGDLVAPHPGIMAALEAVLAGAVITVKGLTQSSFPETSRRIMTALAML